MKPQKYRTVVSELVSILFIILFLYAAASKLFDHENFQVQVGKSPLLARFSVWIGWLVILIEVVTAIAMSNRKYQLTGLYAAFTLMVMFTTYIIIILHFSDYIPCSCGGILENMSWHQPLLFNVFFVCLI